jgi:tRNA pseudouridine32 synthase / 23S rRNA pseudouridine746 synthase
LPKQIEIIYQHQDFVAVNKSPEVDFHDNDGKKGFFNLVQENFEQKLFPVHRLDKVTSGLLILATNKAAAARFEVLFRTKQINKYYIAIAPGKPKKKQGWIKGDMQPSRRGQYKLLRSMEKPAVTYFDSAPIDKSHRGYFLQPKTGKTHQLRVAMKSIGVPIAGDILYGQSDIMSQYDRCYLHAVALRFNEFGGEHLITTPPVEGELFKLEVCQNWLLNKIEQIKTTSKEPKTR